MLEYSLWTLSETEGTPASVLVRGVISQGQVEPSLEEQGRETQDEVSNARERKLTSKGRAYQMEIFTRKDWLNTQLYQRTLSRHILLWSRVLTLENLKGRDILEHKWNISMKPTRLIMNCYNLLRKMKHLVTGAIFVIVNKSNVD